MANPVPPTPDSIIVIKPVITVYGDWLKISEDSLVEKVIHGQPVGLYINDYLYVTFPYADEEFLADPNFINKFNIKLSDMIEGKYELKMFNKYFIPLGSYGNIFTNMDYGNLEYDEDEDNYIMTVYLSVRLLPSFLACNIDEPLGEYETLNKFNLDLTVFSNVYRFIFVYWTDIENNYVEDNRFDLFNSLISCNIVNYVDGNYFNTYDELVDYIGGGNANYLEAFTILNTGLRYYYNGVVDGEDDIELLLPYVSFKYDDYNQQLQNFIDFINSKATPRFIGDGRYNNKIFIKVDLHYYNGKYDSYEFKRLFSEFKDFAMFFLTGDKLNQLIIEITTNGEYKMIFDNGELEEGIFGLKSQED
jgi:hypothetical protein